MPTIAEERHVDASPEEVYAVVSDPVLMATLGPECQRVRWLTPAAAPAPGARFRGYNRHGPFRWSTTATVTDARPGQRFAYAVTLLGRIPVSEWAYELEPHGEGTLVREVTVDRRARALALVGPLTTGVRDRASRNRSTMRATLEGLERLLAERRAAG